jgi:hypothetical protein
MSAKHPVVSFGNTQLRENSSSPIPWVWEGVVAENGITLLSAPEKTGKTTLLSVLLDRRRVGGLLLGRAVRSGRTMLCSEENKELWALRQPPLDFGAALQFCQPIGNPPTRRAWRRFTEYLLGHEFGEIESFDLLVIDTVLSFLPPVERNRAALRRMLEELRLIASSGVGVLLLNQSRAVSRPLAAFVDILLEMRVPRGDRGTRRRHFDGVGRYPSTLQHVFAELNAEGTDYLMLRDPILESAPSPVLETVQRILSESSEPLTRQDILTRWPDGLPPPRQDSLWRTLTRGCEMGVLVRSGTGTRAEAFRYGLCAPALP